MVLGLQAFRMRRLIGGASLLDPHCFLLILYLPIPNLPLLEMSVDLCQSYLTGFSFLCSLRQAPQSPERLRCYYKTGHPLCTIKRCPIEVVFTNPDIMILRNIMTDAEIEKVIQISKPLVRISFTKPLIIFFGVSLKNLFEVRQR